MRPLISVYIFRFPPLHIPATLNNHKIPRIFNGLTEGLTDGRMDRHPYPTLSDKNLFFTFTTFKLKIGRVLV